MHQALVLCLQVLSRRLCEMIYVIGGEVREPGCSTVLESVSRLVGVPQTSGCKSRSERAISARIVFRSSLWYSDLNDW